MKEQLISLETATLAKEKGFNITNRNSYDENTGLMLPLDPYGHCYALEGTCPAPTQSLLQKWLRETHQLHLEIQVQDYVETPKFYWNIFGAYKNNKMIRCIANSPREDYVSYEEALEAGLQKALSHI